MQNRFAREFTVFSIGLPPGACATLRQDDFDCDRSGGRVPVRHEPTLSRPGFTLHAPAVACTGCRMRPVATP